MNRKVSRYADPTANAGRSDELGGRHFASVAALIGEKSRAVMLWNLIEGREYTATELADCAGVSRQTCSDHLSKLVGGGVLTFLQRGRHRYYKFANENVAQVIEKMAYLISPDGTARTPSLSAESGFRYARTCYDHLAGKVAVRLTDALVSAKIVTGHPDKFKVTHRGEEWFRVRGIDIDELCRMKRKFAYPCLDWSERRNHLGGALGAAVLKLLLHNGWIRRKEESREVVVTPKGRIELRNQFAVEI